MPKLIAKPAQIKVADKKPRTIQEFIRRINSQTSTVSIARMQSSDGCGEPGPTPKFNAYTMYLLA